MGPKNTQKTSDGNKTDKTGNSSTYSGFSNSSDKPFGYIGLRIKMLGVPQDSGDFVLLALFNEKVIFNTIWGDEEENEIVEISINNSNDQNALVSYPIIFLLRLLSPKSGKSEQDELLNIENRAGGTIDLLPLLLGEESIFTTLHLISKATGSFYGCDILVHITTSGITELNTQRVPLLLTAISANCLPRTKEGTVYISAIGLTDIYEDIALKFGQTSSSSDAKHLLWASVSNAGLIANTAYSVSCEDRFVPEDLELTDTEDCITLYWNAINRILVDPEILIMRLASPFLIEVAAIPNTGKIELRARYLGWADARVLLEPGQLDVTVCVQLFNYSETRADGVGALLPFPPTSAKQTVPRDSNDCIIDELGHSSYIIIRFDLTEPLVPKSKIASLYDSIGISPVEGHVLPVNELESYTKPEDPFIDARYVSKAGGALAVHDELSDLACRGAVPMNQSIKRSAANLLLMQVRSMLKNFPPGNCSYIDWQDTVTGHHAASRRAVAASFAPQPTALHLPSREAVTKCRIYGDNRLAQKNIALNLKLEGKHSRSLICKVLRRLEERNEVDARNYLFDALSSQVNNRYLLWILGAQEYFKGTEEIELASAAFRISAKGDYSDGTTNAIAWASLHTFYHYTGSVYSAHIAARRMRKFFSLPIEWKHFLKCWRDTSGEDEVCWNPEDITFDDPLLIAAAFFLCLRCYKFCDSLLLCVDNQCYTKGTYNKVFVGTDMYYVRAASFVLRKDPHRALNLVDKAVKRYGPTKLMSQMRVTCLANIHGWNDECERALLESEKAGSTPNPSTLFTTARARFKKEPHLSLQRAARCHQLAPSGHTALLIGRIYERLGFDDLAQRWCAGAIKLEPLLADGWAMLSIIAMHYEENFEKARLMLRTARNAGPISKDIKKDLLEIVNIVGLNKLPDFLIKNMFCGKKN